MRLVRRFFTKDELLNKKFKGSKKAERFNQEKMEIVFKIYYMMYPDPSTRDSDGDCRTAIVTYARSLKQENR